MSNKWGRKLVANEIRPLLYMITESFRKYEAVENIDSTLEQIKSLNDILKNENALNSLNKLSEEKYETQTKIREVDKINDKIKNIKIFKLKIDNFDEEKELTNLEETYKKYFSIDSLITSLDKESSLLDQYKDMQSNFFTYHIIKKLKTFSQSERESFYLDIKTKRYIDSKTLIDEKRDFIYSYVRLDQIHIDSVINYFEVAEPYDYEKNKNILNNSLNDISKKIQDILNKHKHVDEVQF